MNFLRAILYPFSLLYGLITLIRNYLYDANIFKSTRFRTPTIVVGNLSVGGTGKTPQIEYLVRLLQDKYKVAVLSRGYKRKSKGFIIADKNATAETIGDEPFQYFLKFPKIIVSVDANRTNGIQLLEALDNPPDIILLDDAFQHRKVVGGFNILLSSYDNLYINDSMLPTGTLRENIEGAHRAQIVIITKSPEDLSESKQIKIIKDLHLNEKQSVFFTTIDYDKTLKGESTLSLEELHNKKVLLITGIANPNPLISFLKDEDLKFEHLNYPDHHNFSIKEVEEINDLLTTNKWGLTTEKDYVRIFDRIKKLHFISIKTKFINRKKDFEDLINNYVGESTRHS